MRMVKANTPVPSIGRQSFIHQHAPTLAVVPVLAIALLFYFGSTVWSVVMSFTASKIFPDMTFVGLRQYLRGCLTMPCGTCRSRIWHCLRLAVWAA